MDQTYIARTDMENRWSLTSADHALVVAKSQDNRLSFAALLLFFRNHGHFPRTKTEIDHGTAPAILLQLASDPGRPSLASVQDELAKLELIRRLELPADLFDHALPQELERYRQRVAIEAPYELRRHPDQPETR